MSGISRGKLLKSKEYSIAVDAFGRPREFDPTVDSIVRVEAHRLGHKLDLYYRQEGATHRVQIVLPAGGYVPQFVPRPAGELSTSASNDHGLSPATEALSQVHPATSSVDLV